MPNTLKDPAVREALADLSATFKRSREIEARIFGQIRRLPVLGRVPSQQEGGAS